MKRNQFIGAGLLLLLIAIVAWLMMPGTIEMEAEETVAVEAKRPMQKKRVLLADGTFETKEALPLEDDPDIPVVTKTCKWIVEDERRNVPQWVMLDNLRDRGQLFVEDDLRCLTAAGVTPAILDFAERYQDRNALRRAAAER